MEGDCCNLYCVSNQIHEDSLVGGATFYGPALKKNWKSSQSFSVTATDLKTDYEHPPGTDPPGEHPVCCCQWLLLFAAQSSPPTASEHQVHKESQSFSVSRRHTLLHGDAFSDFLK